MNFIRVAEKLLVAQSAKKFQVAYGTLLPFLEIQSRSPFALLCPILLRYILICYHLRLDRSVDILLQDFRPEYCTIIFLTF